jgi:hypothetical protein
MDKIIHKAFLERTTPFAESFKTIFTFEPLSIPEIIDLTTYIVNYLMLQFPDNKIYRFDDWHSHDGSVTSREVWNYQKILDSLKTEKIFIKSSHGNFDVYWAFYPNNLQFMFRYYIDIEDEEGCLDFSAKTIMINELKKNFKTELNNLLEEENTYEFFKKTNAG